MVGGAQPQPKIKKAGVEGGDVCPDYFKIFYASLYFAASKSFLLSFLKIPDISDSFHLKFYGLKILLFSDFPR